MDSCPIDHSLEDVQKKLHEQKPFLPEGFGDRLEEKITADLSQEALNDIFHLLKKYDLAPQKERDERERKLETYK